MSDREPEITNVYIWSNGMVMTFDQYGCQMHEYQGPVEEVVNKILDDAPPTAQWHGGVWGQGLWPIARPKPRG